MLSINNFILLIAIIFSVMMMINGVARYGMPVLMKALGAEGQTLPVGGKTRQIFLEQETADPDVANVSLSVARSTLRAAFRDLPKLARALALPAAPGLAQG